ncbi:hypothetical protein KW800_02265 [Candidatus Parcubacteria bacterium]|nr:hypothetical protein [Candidatus Parcubacteria bacterium]
MCHVILALLLSCASPTTYTQSDKAFEPYWYLWFDSQLATGKEFSRRDIGNTTQAVHTISYGLQRSKAFGLTATASYAKDHGEEWGEATFGYSFAPNAETAISAGPGIELFGDNLRRVRLSLYYDNADKDRPHFLYVQSDFGQGAGWFWADGTYFLTKRLGTGLLIQVPDLGVGLKEEVLLKGKLLSAWGAVLLPPPNAGVDESYLRYAIGGRLKFGN